MAPHTRQRDFLESFAQIQRRVTHLENGAHPMNSGLDYGSSHPTTTLPADGPKFAMHNFATAQDTAKFRKRLSVVHLCGYMLGALKDLDPAGEQVSHLPADCWPLQAQTFFVALTRPPWFTRIDVSELGIIVLYNVHGFTTGVGDRVHLDTVHFVAEEPE